MAERHTILKIIDYFRSTFSTYGQATQDLQITAWQMALEDFTDEEVITAFKVLIKTHEKGFPVPANLIKCIAGKDPDHRASEQWEILVSAIERVGAYQNPDFSNGNITRFVKENGGWKQFCNLTYDELSWKRKEFIGRYNTATEARTGETLKGLMPNSDTHSIGTTPTQPTKQHEQIEYSHEADIEKPKATPDEIKKKMEQFFKIHGQAKSKDDSAYQKFKQEHETRINRC